MATFVVMTTIALAVFFLAYFLIALIREQKTIRPFRVGSTSVERAGYQSLGREQGAVIWSSPVTVLKVARITQNSGRWRRTAPATKKHLLEPRLKLV